MMHLLEQLRQLQATPPLSGTTTNLKYPATGDYPSNDSQSWSYSNTNGNFLISFNALDTESGFDFLNIYQGTDATGLWVARISGTTLPNDILVDGDLYMTFTSDGSSNGSGFDIDIIDDTNSHCGRFIKYPPHGKTESGLTRSWVATPDTPGGQIQAAFTFFETEAGYDFVKVYDGINNSAPLLGTYDGVLTAFNVTTTLGNGIYIEFLPDGSGNDDGFEVTLNCL